MKVKSFYIFIFCVIIFSACTKNEHLKTLKINEIDKERIYIVFRGTDTKEGLIAKEFNLADSKVTHVGFLISLKNKWNVVHILNSDKESDLQFEHLNSFFSVDKNKLHHASIWIIDNISIEQMITLKKELLKYKKYKIKFDRYFNVSDTSKLYCSQFIVKTMKKIDSSKFDFSLHKKKLEGLYKLFLKRDSLEYYPVDIISKNLNIKIFSEWSSINFNNTTIK